MEENQKSFDQELNHCLSPVHALDQNRLVDILGIQKQSQTYVFYFFNRKIIFDQKDFIDPDGQEVTSSVKSLLCRYMINCPESIIKQTNRVITFRKFPGATVVFQVCRKYKQIIEQMFSGQLERLEKRFLEIGFRALPRIPVIFHFNDKDDMLPAQSAFLFHDNADKYLGIKSFFLKNLKNQFFQYIDYIDDFLVTFDFFCYF